MLYPIARDASRPPESAAPHWAGFWFFVTFGTIISSGRLVNRRSASNTANAKVKRDRFLPTDELPRFFQSLAVESNKTLRDYIFLALLTGAGCADLRAMRWIESNRDGSA